MRKTTVDVCLPTHPTLTHPRTGEPLRAIGMSRRGPIWPILGGDGTDNGGGQQGGQGGTGTGDNNQNGGQGGGESTGGQQGSGSGTGTDDDRGYPANTPVAEMTPAQQVNYWKFHARKHENAVRGLGLTPGNEAAELKALREAQAELQKRQDAELSDTERLTKERDELAVENQRLKVEAVRRQALEAAGLTLDDLEFITEVEPDKAIEQAKKLAARLGVSGSGTNGAGRGHDQGHRGGSTAKAGVAAGRDRWAERNKRKTSTSNT